MEITLNITEDSNVKLVNDNKEAVQGECCVTTLKFVYPETINGYPIANFNKHIEFAECKPFGECVKFMDNIDGDTYHLNEVCTQFKSLMVQLVFTNLTDEEYKIVWKTKTFVLNFSESINAENQTIIQAQILGLADVQQGWENFVKTNCIRVVYDEVPEASADLETDTIFYLGTNQTEYVIDKTVNETTEGSFYTYDGADYTAVVLPEDYVEGTTYYRLAFVFEYGCYYKCVENNGVYSWQCLTKDASLSEVANGIKEIAKGRTMQLWVDKKEKLKEIEPQPNVIYVPEDQDIKESFDEILNEMAEDNNYNLAYPIKKDGKALVFNNGAIECKTLLFENTDELASIDLSEYNIQAGDVLEVILKVPQTERISGGRYDYVTRRYVVQDTEAYHPHTSFSIQAVNAATIANHYMNYDNAVIKVSPTAIGIDNDRSLTIFYISSSETTQYILGTSQKIAKVYKVITKDIIFTEDTGDRDDSTEGGFGNGDDPFGM